MKEKYQDLIKEYGIDFTEYPVFMMYEKARQTFTYLNMTIEDLCKKHPDKQVIVYRDAPLRAALIDKIDIANFFIKTGFMKETSKPINPYYLLIQ